MMITADEARERSELAKTEFFDRHEVVELFAFLEQEIKECADRGDLDCYPDTKKIEGFSRSELELIAGRVRSAGFGCLYHMTDKVELLSISWREEPKEAQ